MARGDALGGDGLAECVINISEGRDPEVIAAVAAAGGACLLDVHSDAEHHRSVLTLGGPLHEVSSAARRVAAAAVGAIDLTEHRGIHPRLGAVDVVPFVQLDQADASVAPWEAIIVARDSFASWAGSELGIPCFLYGPERSLPDIRRHAFSTLSPDTGPAAPHPTAGASAVGARRVLIAYNVWIAGPDAGGPGTDSDDDPAHDDPAHDDPAHVDPAHVEVTEVARSLAARLRRPGLRTLGLAVDGGAQVSCNVVDHRQVTLTEVFDEVVAGSAEFGCSVTKGELVGLLPQVSLSAVDEGRWVELGLRAEDTIESRIGELGNGTRQD